jgi:hypothetical protein
MYLYRDCNTFELKKLAIQSFDLTFAIIQVKANLVEAEFLGFMPWIIIQKVTLPLAVFFHFHSAVVFIELFKEVFDDKEESDGEAGPEGGVQANHSFHENPGFE